MKDKIGRECVNCHATADLVYHHIIPLSMGGEDTINNMVCMCGACHDRIHYGKAGAFSHSEAVKAGIKVAKARGVHFGRKPVDHDHIMQTIIENSTQFNPCSHTTEREIMEMLGIKLTTYCKVKRELLRAIKEDVWPYSFDKPKYVAKRPMYDHVVKDIRGY